MTIKVQLGDHFIFRLIFILFLTLTSLILLQVFILDLLFLHLLSLTMGVLGEKGMVKIRKRVNIKGIIFFTIMTLAMSFYWFQILLSLNK